MEQIIIADDHALIQKGVKLLLAGLGYKNVAEVGSCSRLLQELKRNIYTHLILDVVLSDGISLEIVPVIRKLYPFIKIMIFTMQPRDIYAEAFKAHEVYYFLSKSASEEQAVQYIKRFLGEERFPQEMNTIKMPANPFSGLAERELEVLHYIMKGHKTGEIASVLNIGHNTVSTYKRRIFDKTGAKNLQELFELWSVYGLKSDTGI